MYWQGSLCFWEFINMRIHLRTILCCFQKPTQVLVETTQAALPFTFKDARSIKPLNKESHTTGNSGNVP